MPHFPGEVILEIERKSSITGHQLDFSNIDGPRTDIYNTGIERPFVIYTLILVFVKDSAKAHKHSVLHFLPVPVKREPETYQTENNGSQRCVRSESVPWFGLFRHMPGKIIHRAACG